MGALRLKSPGVRVPGGGGGVRHLSRRGAWAQALGIADEVECGWHLARGMGLYRAQGIGRHSIEPSALPQ